MCVCVCVREQRGDENLGSFLWYLDLFFFQLTKLQEPYYILYIRRDGKRRCDDDDGDIV